MANDLSLWNFLASCSPKFPFGELQNLFMNMSGRWKKEKLSKISMVGLHSERNLYLNNLEWILLQFVKSGLNRNSANYVFFILIHHFCCLMLIIVEFSHRTNRKRSINLPSPRDFQVFNYRFSFVDDRIQ